jgi:4-hydroxy-3-methylbut-2-enyl diphosphate reductase IspH
MSVKFLRVSGHRSHEPVVLARVDDHGVRWTDRKGWECDCDQPVDATCPHVEAVADLLDPRVIGDGS